MSEQEEQRIGIEGLDELAGDLGVPMNDAIDGIALRGYSGAQYSLVELLKAHVRLMRQTQDRGRSCGRDDKVC